MGRDLTKIQCDPKHAQHLNETLSYNVVRALSELGVRHYVLCPGGRNAPIVDLVAEQGFNTYLFHDERSAGFFATGKMMAKGEPCAVVVTSGTAVGELLPSVMESYYSRLPLIVISADRPKRFKGSGAPQTAEQEHIFGIYTPHFEDLEADTMIQLSKWDAMTPCHLNLRLEEAYRTDFSRFPDIMYAPFTKRRVPESGCLELEEFLQEVERPLVIVGALSAEETAPVKKFLLELEAPAVIEGHSRLRNDPDLQSFRIVNCDLKSVDGILRLGGVPTTRLWRDTEYFEGKLLSISRKPFAGSSWGAIIHSDLSMLEKVSCPKRAWHPCLRRDFSALYEQYSRSEQALVHKISTLIKEDMRIFLGTSLPIREWDAYATEKTHFMDVNTARGMNGIDGQISTIFGLLTPETHTVGIIGDLTALYDMGGPFVLKDCVGSFTIFIINNGGGKIFKSLYQNPLIQNQHTLGFENFAKMFGLSYTRTLDDKSLNYNIVEVIPDEEQTRAFS